MTEESTPNVSCPKCGSFQIVANKKGFSAGKAVAGAVLTGGIGLLAGTIGSGKIRITCLACAHVFKPGSPKTQKPMETTSVQPKVDKATEQSKWMKDFYASYEAGDKDAAYELLKQKDPFQAKYGSADEAYKKNKSVERKATIGCSLFVVIVLAIIVYFSNR